ncbi:Eco57I restriction-modification methylase domain-containing protein [Mesorhizobium sp. CA16]|uniref:Eco57I restriction-modification methylase domain-containing protein n=1 Tax=Mesorhizobium sp. CA16 TaxID=588496 RepID=UPI001CCC2D6C|nr:Eco57I restriction-modification methylase domain-containing protein [Mesorhizobium sp. CA16]MBZ9910995.1 Eco57I restriction-modification methylase domain-containing protein [Mesorhizobium sp. CA16]
MIDDPLKTAARARVGILVQNFRRQEADYLRSIYNETQARTDFITPLLEAFGWDVHNAAGHPLGLREVIEEATVEVGEERLGKRPDYELRLARQRKLFVEAKKPSVRIDRNRDAAFQTRRYGYSASLPIAVLTNFHQMAVYDCVPKASVADEAHVARLLLIRYDEFEARFDELWPLLSRQAVYSGDFDRRFAIDVTRHGAEQFDDFFLRQVKSWRARLAVDIHAHTPGLSPAELTYAVQLFLSRIVFLRICEDRDLERYETLKDLDSASTFEALMTELRRADAFYDSGLFRLLDDARLGIRISDPVLHGIISELYYPQSPYTFAVVETEVLGEIYEQFLGDVITISPTGAVEIVSKPEVRESGGVFPTPRYIVDAIVARALGPVLVGKSPTELGNFTVADICCGSGIFLLSVLEILFDHHLTWYLANDRAGHIGRTIYEVVADQWRLTFPEKRRILLAHVRGVDIDANAIEVARFSLLLKLIEDESAGSLRDFVATSRTPALPELNTTIRTGNSLVSQAEWTAARGALPAHLLEKVNPFTWATEFPAEIGGGGFNVIVGNPPYIRIQNMTAYSPEEAAFYQSPASPYTTARQDNFDKYALFVERALTLLRPDGRLGVIVPHKFMTTQAGRALRELIAGGRLLEQVVHFGVQQVFGRQATNYTCLLILDRQGRDSIDLERVDALEGWRYGTPGQRMDIPATELGGDTWQFADEDTRILFGRVRAAFPNQLSQVAEIFVGVQTSADPIYIFRAAHETAATVSLNWNGRLWPIERGILRPCLHDAQLFPYALAQANAWMIFPYEIVAGAKRTEARLIQPAEMARQFPECWAYLTARQAELEKRGITGGAVADKQFYQFGRSQSLTKFDSPKIILPILSREARYAYDDANVMMTGGGNGPYYVVRPRPDSDVSNFYLLAVLHHPLSEAMIRTNTSSFRGGYYSHGKQFIEHLPVPIPPASARVEIERLVAETITANDAAVAARTPHQRSVHERNATVLRQEIEARVTDLFVLTPAEIAVARAVPIP